MEFKRHSIIDVRTKRRFDGFQIRPVSIGRELNPMPRDYETMTMSRRQHKGFKFTGQQCAAQPQHAEVKMSIDGRGRGPWTVPRMSDGRR